MKKNRASGFTLIELLTVIAVIAVLAGLILSTAGYVQRKGATARAQTEIKALEAACESYKADNGAYPIDSGTTYTNSLYPGGGSPNYSPLGTGYQQACAVLYQAVTGDGNNWLVTSGSISNSTGKLGSAGKVYIELKPNQTGTSSGLYYIVDPFGFSYGYSTTQATTGTNGYNSTFDLWSTGGTIDMITSGTRATWITNW